MIVWAPGVPLTSTKETSRLRRTGRTPLVSGRAFAAVALVGFLLAAIARVLAAVLDSALMAVAGALCVLAVGVAREGWLWRAICVAG